MANRFKNPMLRNTYDAMVKAYRTKHRDLVRADGSRHKGNAFATNFWRGFDGATHHVDRAYRLTPAYAAYRAGQDMRATLTPDKGAE